MLATILVGIVVAALFGLAIRSIVKQRKNGGCCGSCKGCHGCDLSYDEVKHHVNSK